MIISKFWNGATSGVPAFATIVDTDAHIEDTPANDMSVTFWDVRGSGDVPSVELFSIKISTSSADHRQSDPGALYCEFATHSHGARALRDGGSCAAMKY